MLIRLLAFSAIFALLPSRVIPWSARIAFLFILVTVFAPEISASKDVFQILLAPAGNTAWVNIASWEAFGLEIATGLLFGVMVSGSAYGIFLFARWGALLAGTSLFGEEGDRESFSVEQSTPLQELILLVFVFLAFQGDLIERLVFLLNSARGIELLQMTPSAFASPLLIAQWFGEIGGNAFRMAVSLSLPLFFGVFFVDFCALVAVRYRKGLLPFEVIGAIKWIVVVSILSVVLYSQSEKIASYIVESTHPKAVMRNLEPAP